ncbi:MULTISPECIES: SusD/RagB family nutrient-binding outer membrane lipoprotein [Flavobacterium]|uniref:SusD/RagB family nutrient-binding outer membrane lipoprotein n=1 Tax=Flavobacterium TaxID=237 RepID=UPI001FCAB982|nr:MULTISPECIES: SusD/RagB family nutrient-binding outer membrane lipoprotein [Flavobacterium]UOK42584.1 SusD/RagB family nutrient-binding outer membrane lipoprotein [Flavobacterium enshiense]
MKRIKFILPLIAGFMLFSCSDYLDINKSPNNADGNAVTPDLSLAAAQSDSYRNLTRRMNEYGNVFMNNWGANVNSFTGGYAEEFGIFVSNNFYDDVWDGLYRGTGLYSKIINHPAQGFDNHKAIAKICKAFYFQYLVDLYGDVPYSEAHKGMANVTPKYDDDQEIYKDLIVQLDAAINTIQNPVPGAKVVGTEDVILKGDMAGWVRFANTLKLRILLRQSEVAEADPVIKQYITDEFAKLNGALFVEADVIINPGYSSGSDSRQNPWMNLMVELKKNSSNQFVYRQAFNFRRASAHIAGQLNSTADGRRARIFAPVSGTDITGVIQGDQSALNGGGTAPGAISSLGPGLVRDNGQDGYMMLRAESLLLQAEAAHRGYLPGTPQTLFNQAITASFTTFVATGAPAYISLINGVVGKGYGAPGATSEEQLEAIFYQKDVALNGINGAEIFIEYTRARKNGRPLIDEVIPMPLNSTTPTNEKPRRLMYPISEYASNSANVPVQSISDAYNTAPFWFRN